MGLRIVLLTTLVVLGATFSALAPPTAPAAAITLQNSTAHACTFIGLATAIEDAASGDTITFDCPVNTAITFTSEIVIDKSLAIDGSNGDSSITFDGDNTTRLFRVASSGELTLRRLTLQNGLAVGTSGDNIDYQGGAVYNGGSLMIYQSTFTLNRAALDGGAIYNVGMLTITQSRFSNNSGVTSGGALLNSGNAWIARSSFIDNTTVRVGGAIDVVSGDLEVISSTFSGNTATSHSQAAAGSALYVNPFTGSTTLRWSTIVQPAGTVPALYLWKSITLEGVLLGGEGKHCEFVNATPLTVSHTIANDDSCVAGTTASWENRDLHLGEVTTATVNGVPQTYYSLDTGSPAIDAAADVCREPEDADEPYLPNDVSLDRFASVVREAADLDELDQIGTVRPQPTSGTEPACDIGAIEMTDVPPVTATVTLNNPPFLEGQPNAIDFVVTNPGPGAMYLYISGCRAEETFGLSISRIPSPSATQEIGCIPADQGAVIIWVVVGNGTSVRESFVTFDVLNADPALTGFTATPSTVLTGESVTMNATATDVPADPLTYTYDCGDGTLIGDTQCQFERGGSYDVSVLVTDGDGGEATDTRTIQVFDPANLCANRWNGSLRMADNCSPSENSISLPLANYADLTLCVNQWNGTTRVSDRCSRSEQTLTTRGQDSLHVCINQWNGALRVSDRCSRSEHEDWL